MMTSWQSFDIRIFQTLYHHYWKLDDIPEKKKIMIFNSQNKFQGQSIKKCYYAINYEANFRIVIALLVFSLLLPTGVSIQ